MKVSIKGLVDRIELSKNKALLPLFEAISNAIDAIEEHGDGIVNHSIRIRLIPSSDLATQARDDTLLVDGFDIIDDGVGFNDDNLASFQEAHTLSKAKAGGRGIGRFTFLKVFSSVHIRSVFKRCDKSMLREFDFNIQDEIDKAENVREVDEECGTKISLRGIKDEFVEKWRVSLDSIADNIITHFLIRLAAQSCPPIVLECSMQQHVNLQEKFKTSVREHIKEQSFDVSGHKFALQAYRYPDGRKKHGFNLCANGREVTVGKLKDLLPELPENFVDEEGTKYVLLVLITGEYLDAHANQERTRIIFQDENGLDLEQELISLSDLKKGIADTLRPLLADDLKAVNDEKMVQIERFVEQAPEYRILLKPCYRERIEREIQPGLTEEKLDVALHQCKRKIEQNVGEELRHAARYFEKETFEQYERRLQALVEQVNDLGKSELAKYVTHRRAILDLLFDNLKKQRSDEKYSLEKVLHNIIFPMGATSKDIFFEQQNLWVIDERLCYHTLLTSDKKLKGVAGLEDISEKEPDIFGFFYDTPVGVAEPNNLQGGCVVIIEFKRPGRNNYDKDPADQIIQRFREIDKGGVTDIDGRPINPTNLRYIGYLIADLTPSLRNQVYGRYHENYDKEGYFSTLATGKGYIEIISYNKLLDDARRRNRILFEKLGLHKN